MAEIKGKREPRPGSAGRATKKGEARDMPMTGAAGRGLGTTRGQYPKAGFPQPENAKPRKAGGDPYSTALPNRQVQGPAVRKGGGSGKPAGSRKSPFRSKGGGGTANTSKSAKTAGK